MALPNSIKNVIAALAALPSIGPRQATRVVFHLLSGDAPFIETLADEIKELARVKRCGRCYFVHANGGDLCDYCRDTRRAHNVIMVVEKETDVLSVENTGRFPGRYHVVGQIAKTGLLEDWQKARLETLKDFISKECGGKAEEIILGFSPTTLGNFQAGIMSRELAPCAARLTRLARGLPAGGEIEFADDETLGSALEGRS